MRWDNLRVFLAIARAGQILGAAKRLGLDQATVSRRLGALEDNLGARLFERHTSGVILTSAGERLLPIAERMETEALQAMSSVGQSDISLAGTVRIGAPDGFGSYFLAPLLAEFASDHPDLRIQLVPLPRSFSLSKREADIAITLERPTEGKLYARKLTDYTLGLYGSTEYFARIGPITSLDDMKKCLFVTYVRDLIFSAALDYGHECMDRAGQVLECASVVGQMQALQQSGVGFVHDYAAQSVHGLTRIMPEMSLTLSYWVVTHEDVRGLRRVTQLLDYIYRRVEDNRARFMQPPAA